MPNIPEIKPEDLKKILELLDKMDNPPGLMVYGPPGVGKTTILKKFAEEKNYELRVKHLSRMDQTDWSGIPKENKGFTGFLPISLFKPAANGRKIVLFFDELNTAHPGVLNAALDVILEKKGDTETFGAQARLPLNTIIVAAGNLGPDEDGTYVEELSMAVKTRMVQVRLNPDLEQWISWAEKNEIHKYVIEFIKKNGKEYLLDLNEFKNRNDQAATPRGWERISDFLKTIESQNIEEKVNILKNFTYGVIGYIKGRAFIDFYESQIKGKDGWLNKIREYEYLFNRGNLIVEINKIKEFFNLINEGMEQNFPDAPNYADSFINKILIREINNKQMINALRGKENKFFMEYLRQKYSEIYKNFAEG